MQAKEELAESRTRSSQAVTAAVLVDMPTVAFKPPTIPAPDTQTDAASTTIYNQNCVTT